MENKAHIKEKTEEGYHATNHLYAKNIAEEGVRKIHNGIYFSPINNETGENRVTHYCRRGTGYLVSKVIRELLKSQDRKHYAENPELCRQEAVRIAREESKKGPGIDLSGGVIPKDLVDLIEFQGAIVKAKIPHSYIDTHSNGKVVDGEFKGYEILTERLEPEYITEFEEVQRIFPDELIVDKTLSEILASPINNSLDIMDKFPRIRKQNNI